MMMARNHSGDQIKCSYDDFDFVNTNPCAPVNDFESLIFTFFFIFGNNFVTVFD